MILNMLYGKHKHGTIRASRLLGVSRRIHSRAWPQRHRSFRLWYGL